MNGNRYIEGANLFLDEVCQEIGSRCDRDRAWRIVRSVFHALRERLTVEESFNLISEIPMLLKALYVDGWQPQSEHEKVRSAASFVEAVWSAAGNTAQGDFLSRASAEDTVRKTIAVINRHLSAGEKAHIRGNLPHPLRSLFGEEPRV